MDKMRHFSITKLIVKAPPAGPRAGFKAGSRHRQELQETSQSLGPTGRYLCLGVN